MRYSVARIRQSASARGSFVVLALLALAPACRRDDPLPTGPPLAVPSAPVAAVLGADVTDIGFDGAAINESGQVAGTAGSRAALYTPGQGVQDLGTLGGTISVAYAINEPGQVVGYSTTATGAVHAFLWTSGAGMQDLGVLDGGTSATARGINDLGQVVGEVTLPPVGPRRPAKHAFLWTSGHGMQDLGTLRQDLTSSIAYDINNAGQVVGRAFSADRDWEVLPPGDPEFFSRAFLWAPGQGMRDLGDLGGGHSIAHAINDAGQVVGRSWLSVRYHAFRWTSGEGMRDLGAFGPAGDSSSALGINEAGQIVGWSTVGVGPWWGINAFIWTASEGLENLTPTTGIPRARGINNHQQVVGDWRVATVHLGPGNVPPVARAGGPYTGTEGSQVQFDPSGTDLDGGELYGHVFYGDGTDDIIDGMLPYVWHAVKHVYADNGTYTLTLIVRDTRGGSDTATTTVTIANVAPTILPGSLTGPAAPIQLTGGSASAPLSFEFKDMGGKRDVYAAEIACGNGVVLTATEIPVVEIGSVFFNTYAGGKGAYTGACTYTSAGVYTIRVTVSDEDGGTSVPAFFRYVIVYDPAGGSVTAGGWYSVGGQGNRKAHFTFDAGFHGTVPNGTVRLWVPGGDMNFESSAIEMLVVSGNRAQFWGTGTLNGAPARFRITTVDNDATRHHGVGDAIRVELWDASGATVLYDTQPGAPQDASVTTPTEGGNIRIRAG